MAGEGDRPVPFWMPVWAVWENSVNNNRLVVAISTSTLLLGGLLGGCGTRHNWNMDQASHFPSKGDLQELVAAPIPDEAMSPRNDVPTLAFTGELPHTVGQSLSERRPLDELVVDGRKGWVLTENAKCAATQIGSLQSAHGDLSRQSMQLVSAACGLTSMPRWLSYGGEVPASTTTDDVLGRWADDIKRMLASGELPAQAEVGAAVVRAEGKVQFFFAVHEPEVALRPFTRQADGNNMVHIEGRVRTSSRVRAPHSAYMVVNQGDYAYARCVFDDHVELPAFSAHCPVNPQDDLALLQLVVMEKGRMIGPEVLRTMVRPSGRAVTKVELPHYVEETAVDDASTRAPQFAALVNSVRKRINAPALALADAQSASYAHAAPAFFTRMLASERTGPEVDQMMLGLLAGWDVTETTLRDGDISWSVARGGTHSVGRLVNQALSAPIGRRVLLDPNTEVLAVGFFDRDEAGLNAAVYAAWETFSVRDPAQERRIALASLKRARGGKKTGQMTAIDELVADAALSIDGGEDLSDIMNDALDQSASTMQASMMAHLVVTHDLYDIDWPDQLKHASKVFVSCAVAMYKPKSAPWGQYVIIVMAHYPHGTQTAARGRPSATRVAQHH